MNLFILLKMSINSENLIKIFNSCDKKSYEKLLDNLEVITDELKLFLIENFDECEIYKIVKIFDITNKEIILKLIERCHQAFIPELS